MGFCTVKTWFSHDPPFAAGESCPLCGQEPPGPSEIDPSAVVERQIMIAPPRGPPPTPLPTVSAPPAFLSSARLAIETARASRASAITVATSNTPLALNPPKDRGRGVENEKKGKEKASLNEVQVHEVRFAIRVAHVRTRAFDIFPVGWYVFEHEWIVSIEIGTILSAFDFEFRLRDDRPFWGRGVTHFRMMLNPIGSGRWASYITHVQESKKKHKGTLSTPFSGKKPIKEAVYAMGWRLPLHHLHPATMVWFQDAETPSSSPLLGSDLWKTPPPAEPRGPSPELGLPLAPPLEPLPATGHKRTVSEAIPRGERVNGPEQVNGDETTEAQQVIAPSNAAGIRRSGRATKGARKTKE